MAIYECTPSSEPHIVGCSLCQLNRDLFSQNSAKHDISLMYKVA